MKIYHITDDLTWKSALESGGYKPAKYEEEGFIHCSTSNQLSGVISRYYINCKDLLLLEIDPSRLASPLVFENLEGGENLYPHIYGILNLESVTKVKVFSTFREDPFPVSSE